MRCVFVCPDGFLWRLLDNAGPSVDPVHVVERPAARALISRRGGEVYCGSLTQKASYRGAFRTGQEPVLLAVPPGRQPRVVAAIRHVAPDAPIVALGEAAADHVVPVAPRTITDRVIEPALAQALTRARVQRLRAHVGRAERLLILLQDDPDPDAIGSALALRAVLGRSRPLVTIGTFGTIRRPENRAMTRILEIDIEQVKPRSLEDYDMLAMVDTQPSFFEERLDRVDVVIDHHPEERPARAPLKDIRPSYGATATILVEYLRAMEMRPSQRLATALLYAISTDTRHLERGAGRADMEAFAWVHAHANQSALRRIERPDLPEEALDVLARGIATRRIANGVVFVHLGAVAYPELIAQFADFFLQVEGAEWSVVSGTVPHELHVSVRNVGYVRAAGEVVRQAFGDLGRAGGHRSMAKAVVRLRDWRARVGPTTAAAVAPAVVTRFTRALRS